ncbi:MAG: DUF748 domain-containing protein, partial [Gammaproteobacteria bacterium]|nr:DUF748 domain-containing protein [Gammaproteobacteria bacterium]
DNITLVENSVEQLVLGNKLYKAANEKEQDSELLTIAKVSIPAITLAKMTQLEIDEVTVEGITAMVRRSKEGVWVPVTLVDAIPQQAEKSKSEEAVVEKVTEESPQTTFKIGKFTLTGDNNFLFDDQGVAPPYSTTLSIKNLEIGAIDSTKPEQPSPLHMLAAVDKHSEISVEGTITPLAQKPAMALTNTIKAIPLSPLSSYVVPMMGYTLTSGQLDADADIKMGQGKIDGEIKLTLNALEVEAVVSEEPKPANTTVTGAETKSADTEENKKSESQLSIPLGTALNMLRDKNRTIKLTIPISGNSDNPDIDPSDVINTAISKAMKKGAMSYLIASLQPYGALISLAKIAGEAAMKVRLEPVKFAPSSAAVNSETKAYLQKVLTLMNDRPEVNIKVCGVAVEADYQTLLTDAVEAAKLEAQQKKVPKGQPPAKPITPTISDEQLLELAKARVIAIKDLLITELKADATHLIDCQPQINRETAENPPRVELLI